MSKLHLSKSLGLLLLVAGLPILAWSVAELCWHLAFWNERGMYGAGLLLVKRGLVFKAVGLFIALGAVLAGGLLWRRRLNRQIDTLVEACRSMALGEPSPLPDAPRALKDLNRLALAIQVMHEALFDYLSLYRRFFDAAPDMFLSLAPASRRILEANQAFCRGVGRLRDEVLGQPVGRFVTLDKGWDNAVSSVGDLLTGHIESTQGTLKIEASINLAGGPEGQPWVLGVILRDVTLRETLHGELLRKSTALEKALEEIKDVEELKDEFLTTLSHELKTPLVSLKGFLQLLRQGRGDASQTLEYLDICWRNLSKLEKQINNLLDLARLSHSKEQFEMDPVDLAALVRTEAENLRAAAAEQRVRLDVSDMPEGAVMVQGNLNQLIQLVDNLLVNAIKYNIENGEVKIALRRQNGSVVLTVADSGVGIDREHMATIFNKFYRADITGTGRLEGLGIGLSLVQEIVKLHKGDIKVDSEPGLGTTFTVTLEALP